MTAKLLIVGASARAAAFSALRAGLDPVCADLFADRDLRAACPVRRVDPADYPRGFLSLPEWDEPGPWMYTGGLENHPDLVDELARRRPLWGNGGDVLRRVRSPVEVERVLRAAGLPCPAVWTGAAPPEPDGMWVVKPLASAGGVGVHRWAVGVPSPRRPSFFQRFIDGEPMSALYDATLRGKFLGATRQLVGQPWLHAAPFHYCGSVGPLKLDAPVLSALRRLGAVLTNEFRLRGLFGVDFVARDGVPWPVEVNPRYTASVEVLEAAELSTAGKAILFAKADAIFPEEMPPNCADVPMPGERVEAGTPVLTFFADGEDMSSCLEALKRRAADLDRWLFGP